MKVFYIIAVVLFFCNLNAQFKEELNKPKDIKGGITNYQPSQFFLDFIDPDKFKMEHTFSLSYTAFGNQGISLGIYTNSMSYQFSDNLNLEVDASLVTSPYNTFGDEFTNKLNGLYISRAELNYKPMENMQLKIQYFKPPNGINPFYGYYRNPFWW